MFNNLLYIFLLLICLASCKKDKKEYDITPQLEYIGISPSTVNEFQPLIISFKYTDGDGDLGENNPDVKNLFVTDNRVGITYAYRIKQLAPDNAAIPITGNLDVKIDNAVITNNSNEQSVSYTLYIVDRAGHSSNIITTGGALIKK